MKAIFIDDIDSTDLNKNPDYYIQNGCFNWMQCFTDWQTNCLVKRWLEVTAEECQSFDFVLIKLIPDANPIRLNKLLSVCTMPGRKYKTILHIDDVVGWQMNPMNVEAKKLYLDVVAAADFVVHFGQSETDGYWRAITKDKPHYNIVRPYAIQAGKDIRQRVLPKADKIIEENQLANRSLIALDKGLQNISEERNIISSLYIARKIQQRTNWSVLPFVTRFGLPADVKDDLYWNVCELRSVVEIPTLHWLDYMKVLSYARIAVHLDCLETLGQFAIACACLKIPLICSGSVAGKLLYPDTYINNCRNVDAAQATAEQLLTNDSFRNHVIDFAYNAAEQFTAANTKVKLERMLGTKI
jgi:hypothetical protein